MRALIPLILFAATVPALAQPPAPCLQASGSAYYNARPLSLHQVIARNAVGADKRAYVVSTTCIHIDREALVGLHSFGHCLDKGDNVAVTTLDGRVESCRVSGVDPTTGDYGQSYRR